MISKQVESGRMEQLKRAILNLNQTDFVVAGVSALACLGTLAGMPV